MVLCPSAFFDYATGCADVCLRKLAQQGERVSLAALQDGRQGYFVQAMGERKDLYHALVFFEDFGADLLEKKQGFAPHRFPETKERSAALWERRPSLLSATKDCTRRILFGSTGLFPKCGFSPWCHG